MGVGDRRFRVMTDLGTDISLPLDFHGDQPCHFGAPRASAVPLELGGFVGDVLRGGSCNCEMLTLVPHCNGTHTESVAHLTAGASASSLAIDALIPVHLLTVPVRAAESSDESADPGPVAGDRWVTAEALRAAAGNSRNGPQPGLVVRTLPNHEDKRVRDYGSSDTPPYFTIEAVDLVVSWGVRHLLIDLPSLDRAHDQGRLTGHRRFWGLPAAGASSAPPARPGASITEMIFVPDRLPDGLYALSLQIAPFVSDAAPSRPLLFPLEAA